MRHPSSEPTDPSDADEITDVDLLSPRMELADFDEVTPFDMDAERRYAPTDTVEDFISPVPRAPTAPRHLIPTTSEILKLTGFLITPTVAAEWRDMAKSQFEQAIQKGDSPEKAAREAVEKCIPISSSGS